ncbi:hypothetical protein PRIPAC_73726 [Pristionchus pacificus]|uniref:Uncharacterized protein n=1 Tax=Pristionchus pacificus TaxID=54126 RepID=A0A2A6CS16_PRIPA|nr:hypothetical protein PRIPAC_73726 [Pristionchus pacificus]|eukprot:PDM80886.1 hypothetical protein PRIPAC_35889 [Pristionchus pacificus]
MSSSRSVVCCSHGVPCITGNFSAAFEGLHLSDLGRRRARADSDDGSSTGAQTAYCRSRTAISHTIRSSTSNTSTIYENHDSHRERDAAKSTSDKKKHSSSKRSGREEKSEGVGSSGKTMGSRGGVAVKVYIGIKTSDDAERIVTRATDFKIYHRIPGNRDIASLHTTLPLYIVYRSTKNAARHIPITSVVENKRRFLSAGACGRDKKKLLFETIDALVKYYKTYVQLQPQGKSGMVDVFPA